MSQFRRLVIASGRIIDPASGFDAVGDLVVENGRVAQIGGRGTLRPDDEVIDAGGCIVAPGLIDPHVHLREPGGEDAETIATGSAAALDGGFTTVCCMPNTNPPVDGPVPVEYINRRAELAGGARVFPVGAVTKGRQGEALAEIMLMSAAGAVGFSDDGDVVESPAVMRKALQLIRLTGKVLMQHCQERSLTRGASMNAGPTATRLGLIGWPAVAEEMTVERDVRLNREIGCRYHVQHLSCAGSVEIVRRARTEGQPVTAEASPHHLLLTDEACEGYNTLAKMNPPLRRPADIEAIKAGIADGTITVLATDHAPHTVERKSLAFEQAPFGIVGLETALALYIRALIEPGVIGWPRLIAMMTVEPAGLCNLDREPLGLGRLAIGGVADVTVIDPLRRWTIRGAEFAGKSRNTPFEGWEVTGRAVLAVVGGVVKMNRTGKTAS